MSFTSEKLELQISDKDIEVTKFLEKIGDRWCSSVMNYDYKTHDPKRLQLISHEPLEFMGTIQFLTGRGYHSFKPGSKEGNAIFNIPAGTYYIVSDCMDMIVSERIEFVKFKD